MTFYQELQLSQAGSKAYIASFQNPKDRIRHSGIYLFKILLTVAFCTVFIALFSVLFSKENSIAGLAVLLSIMVFRQADLGIRATHGVVDIFLVFAILAVGPRVSNLLPAGGAFCVNVFFIMLLMLLGCHHVIMYNHSTLVLAYLLLQGYDVTGALYSRRLLGLFAGAVLTAAVYYRNHRKNMYKRTFRSLFQEFSLSSARTKWQLRHTLTISSIMLIAALLDVPKAMWAGIAAMSVCVPFRKDIAFRVKYRILGNVLGGVMFIAAYMLLPQGAVSYMGILGGIGTGFSASYGWQTAFNAFSSLSTAAPLLGMWQACLIRISYNTVACVYTWLFDRIFEPVISVVHERLELIKAKKQKHVEAVD